MNRNTVNIQAIISELESWRLALVNCSPSSITQGDIADVSQMAKILVLIMSFPDQYDEALMRAVSARLQQSLLVAVLYCTNPSNLSRQPQRHIKLLLTSKTTKIARGC